MPVGLGTREVAAAESTPKVSVLMSVPDGERIRRVGRAVVADQEFEVVRDLPEDALSIAALR
jgi:hypothetical protein